MPTGQDGARDYLARAVHLAASTRDGDGARLEIPDQPGIGARGAGRGHRRRLNHQRRLRSRDTDLMIGALEALGLRVDGPADELAVSGTIAPPPDARIDCGLAGTVLRFVPPLAALGRLPSRSTATSRPGSARSPRC